MVADPPALGQGPLQGGPCAHHWLIESPSGESSEGVCKLCGARRRFSNYRHHQPLSPGRRAEAGHHGRP